MLQYRYLMEVNGFVVVDIYSDVFLTYFTISVSKSNKRLKTLKKKTDLLEDEGSGATSEPVGVEVVQTTVDSRQVSGPHVLAGINSESSHTHVNQLVHEASHHAPDVIFLQGEVQQTNQTTVTHLEQQMSYYITI